MRPGIVPALRQEPAGWEGGHVRPVPRARKLVQMTPPPKVLEHVVHTFDVTTDDLLSRTRIKHVTWARQVAMYLCREAFGYSYPTIGACFKRDHVTAMHAVRTVKAYAQRDVAFAEWAATILSDINAPVRRLHPVLHAD